MKVSVPKEETKKHTTFTIKESVVDLRSFMPEVVFSVTLEATWERPCFYLEALFLVILETSWERAHS